MFLNSLNSLFFETLVAVQNDMKCMFWNIYEQNPSAYVMVWNCRFTPFFKYTSNTSFLDSKKYIFWHFLTFSFKDSPNPKPFLITQNHIFRKSKNLKIRVLRLVSFGGILKTNKKQAKRVGQFCFLKSANMSKYLRGG